MKNADDMSPTPTRIRFGTRWLFIVVSALAVLFAGFGWFYREVLKPHQLTQSIQQRLESLANRRPNNMTPRQWESAVAWTLNLHGNSLIRFQASTPEIRRFDERLSHRLAGNVDMTTIYWIWDEYADICSGGADYQRFKSQMDGEIAVGGGNWGMTIP